MRAPGLVAALLAAWVRSSDVGVCWTRNGLVDAPAAALEGKLSGVWLSATLLRRGSPTLPRCLITDAVASAAQATLDALSARVGEAPGLVDRVVAARAWSPGVEGCGHATRDARKVVAAVGQLDAKAVGRFRSRASRLLGFLEPPFGTTLFVDDDTAFCGSGATEFLRAVHRRRDLGHVDVFLTKEVETHGLLQGPEHALGSVRLCAGACGGAEKRAEEMTRRDMANCHACRIAALAWDPTDRGPCPGLGAVGGHWAQAGAFVARRSNGTRHFVRQWLDHFLHYHLVTPGWRGDLIEPGTKHPDRVANREFGRDQPPLGELLRGACDDGRVDAPWTLGKLPAYLNVRKTNEKPVSVWGTLVVLHTKWLTVEATPVYGRGLALASDACDRATRNASWRRLAMPESPNSRALANDSCTTTAEGLLAVGPYARYGARLVRAVEKVAADLVEERRRTGGRACAPERPA